MSVAPPTAFRTDTGILVADRAVLEALVRLAAERTPLPDEAIEPLAVVGAFADGRLHPLLELALRPVAGPRVELVLERAERVGRGWIDHEHLTLITPLPDGTRTLRVLPAEYTPDALARLNDLSPRPRYEPALRVDLSPAALAALLARGDRPAGATADEERALTAIADGLREHWRATARWRAPAAGPGEPVVGERSVEVLDTDAGLWLVTPQAHAVEVLPTTPSTVFLLLAALLPDDDELAS